MRAAAIAKTITASDVKMDVISDNGAFTLQEFSDLDDNVHADNTITLSTNVATITDSLAISAARILYYKLRLLMMQMKK